MVQMHIVLRKHLGIEKIDTIIVVLWADITNGVGFN